MSQAYAAHANRWIDAVRIAALIGWLCIAGSARSDVSVPTGGADTRSSRGVLDAATIRRYLASVHGVGPKLRKECGGAAPLQDLHIAYARLLGTADEQALVEATTCMMGNGGADIVLVLRMGARRQIEPLTVDDSSRPAEELYDGQRRTPRIEAREGRLVRWFVKDNPMSKLAAIRREITYRWAGDRFVIDTVRDLSEPSR